MLTGMGANVGGGDLPGDQQTKVRDLVGQFETALLDIVTDAKIPRRFIRPTLAGSVVCGVFGSLIYVGYSPHLGMPSVIMTTLQAEGRPDLLAFHNLLRDSFGVDFAVLILNEDWLSLPDRKSQLNEVAVDLIAREMSYSQRDANIVSNVSVFGPNQYPIQENLVFVIMPFESGLTDIYNALVKPTVETKGLVCRRGDDTFSNNSIIQDIWKSICESRFVIADISSLNPNVMYELGIAHAIGKETILVNQKNSSTKFPFDISHIRIIDYENTATGGNSLRQSLDAAIDSVLSKLTAAAMRAS